MTDTAAGRWTEVTLRDGTTRQDWLPDVQPPSPDGTPGTWHVVGAPGGEGHWEWWASAPLPAPSMSSVLRPLVDTYRSYRAAVLAGLVVLALLAAVVLVRTGGSSTATKPSSGTATIGKADLEFPKHYGPWTLYSVTVERDPETGHFDGRATVGNTDAERSTPRSRIVIEIVRRSRVVGRLTGTADEIEPGRYRTVDLGSRDDWVRAPDGFTFRAG